MLYICKLSNRDKFSKMKNLIFVSLFLLFGQFSIAQRHEIGVKLGMSNIVGDIGKTNYIQMLPSNGVSNIPISVGVSYKRNLNPYQGVKLSLGYHSIHFNDSNAKELYRYRRNAWGTNDILEASLIFEYNFLPINNEVRQSMWSPYIFGGFSALYYDNPTTNFIVSPKVGGFNISTIHLYPAKKFSLGIPFGVGIKHKFNTNWSIYGELTFRPTFTDDLDYNNIENTNYSVTYQNISTQNSSDAVNYFNQFIENNKIGNTHSKDWLNSITIGLSYSFGRPPCYCD